MVNLCEKNMNRVKIASSLRRLGNGLVMVKKKTKADSGKQEPWSPESNLGTT